MKRFTAILFAALLVWMPFAFIPAASATCGKVGAPLCGMACNGHMACCGTNAPTPPPTVPPPASASQNQVSLLAPAMIAWLLPSAPANVSAPVSGSPLRAMSAPAYARNCSLLL